MQQRTPELWSGRCNRNKEVSMVFHGLFSSFCSCPCHILLLLCSYFIWSRQQQTLQPREVCLLQKCGAAGGTVAEVKGVVTTAAEVTAVRGAVAAVAANRCAYFYLFILVFLFILSLYFFCLIMVLSVLFCGEQDHDWRQRGIGQKYRRLRWAGR